MVEHTRTLDFKVAFAIGLGTMIAAGIFSLSGTAVAAIGSSAVIAFVIAALVASITAAAYSEFASIYSENGGGYLFCSRTFDRFDTLKYGVGMALFLGYTGTTAFYLATMDEWFFMFILPESFAVLPRGTIGVLAAIALGALNAQGTEESGGFQVIVTAAKVAVLFVFIGGAIAYAGPGEATTTFTGGFEMEAGGIVSIAALAFITFFGFSAIAASAGEIIEPTKTVPRAIAASIVTVTVLYTLVIVAMVNAPVPNSVLEQGETAMGQVAASFLGPVGQYLIVAGAVFSMISASNASILAASGIGALMGRNGQGPRRFSRIHPDYGTPSWSIGTATALICLLIIVFMSLLGHHGLVAHDVLGLEPLTGFATFNLLLPLAVVNGALVFSRRNRPNLTRGFRMPGSPVLPVVGIVANLALIYMLPTVGVLIGTAVVVVMLGVYLAWGGTTPVDEMSERASLVTPTALGGSTSGEESLSNAEAFRVLVPIARPDRAPKYVRLARSLAGADHENPVVQLVTVTDTPDQTPSELMREENAERLTALRESLAEADVDTDNLLVESHICRDIGFDIVQTARDDGADRIMMGLPEEHPEVTERVEYEAPCGVLFVGDVPEPSSDRPLVIGTGEGPHQVELLSMVRRLGEAGIPVVVANVTPSEGGTSEHPESTLTRLEGVEVDVVDVTAPTVAAGLVEVAEERGGTLVVGASRTRRLDRWMFGSTPDRAVDLANDHDVPVAVYAHSTGVPDAITSTLFPVYRYARKLFSSGGPRQVSPE
ncbi:amino acid permease [Halomarina salina]|uniref:Amino acid permease n=1 Tax=Halomarina salina TaxID=1872699 RepID=A0ABD5RQN8_9EURY|nr:amino acid permease [Halomarina salina]